MERNYPPVASVVSAVIRPQIDLSPEQWQGARQCDVQLQASSTQPTSRRRNRPTAAINQRHLNPTSGHHLSRQGIKGFCAPPCPNYFIRSEFTDSGPSVAAKPNKYLPFARLDTA
jgi:hypothetical protein